MRKEIILIFIILFLISQVSAVCSEGQIDVNTASASGLDELYGIGEVKSQAIIDARPFNSVDDLINVYGIGEATLNQIKSQGLACVDTEEEQKESVQETQEISEIDEEKKLEQTEKTTTSPEVIKLIPKDIKSEDDKRILDKSDYAKYGFVVFGFLIGLLFILKNRRKNRNELV